MSMNVHRLNHASLNVAWLNRVGEPMSACKGAEVFWEEATYSGNDILFIKDMKFNSITKLALGGGCYQSGTPTPVAPLDILTNKGAIKLVRGKNLLEVKDDNIVVGKYINNAGVVTDSLPNLYFQRFVAVKPNTAYTLSTSESLNYANFMEYDSDGVFIKRTLYGASGAPAGKSVTHTMGETTAFVIVGSNVNATKYPSITKDDVKGIKWMFVEGSTAASYQAYSEEISIGGEDKVFVYNKNLSVGELVSKGYASTGSVSTSTTFCGNLHKIPVSEGQKYTVSWGNFPDGMSGVFINTWKTDGSWNMRQAISATDKLTFTIPSGVGYVNFTIYKTGGITIGADTWLQVEYGDTATDYVPAITPTSESAELLMGVDSYVDVQDLIGGVVTRKVGYKVLDGSEHYTLNDTFSLYIKDSGGDRVLCTHYPEGNSGDYRISNYGNKYVYIYDKDYNDTESFRQFLAMEYAKGTPVIIVYPLAEESVVNVSKKAVGNPKGDVTIIREANVDGLSMEVVCSVKGEKPESGGMITFTIRGESLELQAQKGMTWLDWCNSEFNPYTWDNVLANKSTYEIYTWYDENTGEFHPVSVDVYDYWQIGAPEPEMTDSYTLAYNGVELRASDTIIDGAIYDRYNGNKEITFNAYVITSGGGIGGGMIEYENQTFTAISGMTWGDYFSSDYGYYSPFGENENGLVVTWGGDDWSGYSEYLILYNDKAISTSEKIIADAQYDINGR